ncbi:hypothetical protein CAEBREN_22279 [Caenorhabditis brenneri]|uniref:RecF/RecN/SMC N-terminal domain-containing protein n=1 Tax=Caenorhabditis brenneri TaxID=135651 RepID=G0NIQ8_CAEBE|nr:hypothetical protein CAEBREN_22279 [Caenorhabditis brenneri]
MPYRHGTRPIDVELLSGGEKKVASVAFLLALNLAKGSPFFVLDKLDKAFHKDTCVKVGPALQELGKEMQIVAVCNDKHMRRRHRSRVFKENEAILPIAIEENVPRTTARLQLLSHSPNDKIHKGPHPDTDAQQSSTPNPAKKRKETGKRWTYEIIPSHNIYEETLCASRTRSGQTTNSAPTDQSGLQSSRLSAAQNSQSSSQNSSDTVGNK